MSTSGMGRVRDGSDDDSNKPAASAPRNGVENSFDDESSERKNGRRICNQSEGDTNSGGKTRSGTKKYRSVCNGFISSCGD